MPEFYMYDVSWFDIATGLALPPECKYAVSGSGSPLAKACASLGDTNIKVRQIEKQVQETPTVKKADALLSAYAIRYAWLEKVGKLSTDMRQPGGWTSRKELLPPGATFAGGVPKPSLGEFVGPMIFAAVAASLLTFSVITVFRR